MTDAELLILKDEIDTDPLTRGYSGMTDAQVAADMNLLNRNNNNPVTSSRVAALLITKFSNQPPGTSEASGDTTNGAAGASALFNAWGMLKEMAESQTIRGVGAGATGLGVLNNSWNWNKRRVQEAQALWSYLQMPEYVFDVTQTNVAELFDNMGHDSGNGLGIFKQQWITEIRDLVNKPLIARWQEIGLPELREIHVTQARALP